jgi:hypothetical protein
VIERPEGIKIASFFIIAIVITSLISRVWRTTELRAERIELDETAQRFVDEASKGEKIHIVCHRHRRASDDPEEYATTEKEQREDNHVPEDIPILFLEVDVDDPSEFKEVLKVRGAEVDSYKVLRTESPERYRGFPATSARHDRQRTALLFWLDGGQPHRVSVPLRLVRGGGHRPGHPRGAKGG